MADDIIKHLIGATLDMVQMTRHGSVDEGEANLDLWNAVHGSVNLPGSFTPADLERLVGQIRGDDQGQVEQALAEVARRPASELMQGAALALAQMLAVCCEWVDGQSGSEAGDQMLAHVRERFQD